MLASSVRSKINNVGSGGGALRVRSLLSRICLWCKLTATLVRSQHLPSAPFHYSCFPLLVTAASCHLKPPPPQYHPTFFPPVTEPPTLLHPWSLCLSDNPDSYLASWVTLPLNSSLSLIPPPNLHSTQPLSPLDTEPPIHLTPTRDTPLPQLLSILKVGGLGIITLGAGCPCSSTCSVLLCIIVQENTLQLFFFSFRFFMLVFWLNSVEICLFSTYATV